MNYILFDGTYRNNLLPLTFTRPMADIRIGILTIREKWEHMLNAKTSTQTEAYLSEKFPLIIKATNVVINASFLPTKPLVNAIETLRPNQALIKDTDIIAYCSEGIETTSKLSNFEIIKYEDPLISIKHTWDIFSKNAEAIAEDFKLITKNRISQPIPKTVNTINPEAIFIEEGATLNFAILNASNGPIYIGKNAEIMEGAIIRGPLALCNNGVVKLGAKIYGPTTIGPFSKVGGEVNNAVIFGYTNKGHDGFLGNAVLGEWCNLGADTNNSNLKNNYAEVRLWDYKTEGFAKTGLQFCGLIMGDHSKCGINTMFNTGTVVGVSSNIFGSGFPRNFVPSFSWGGNKGFTTYRTTKAFEVAERVMARRKVDFTATDKTILDHIFEITKFYRRE